MFNPKINYKYYIKKNKTIKHISLADIADLFLICPATANIIGKTANGIADDLLTTSIMATNATVLICPAMNVKMWKNTILQDNIKKLRKINFELTKQMRILAEIARKRNIPVLVTNQIYHWENERKMVAGDILDYWSKCLIELLNEGGRRTAHLRKHRSLPDKKFAFQIVNEGVRKKGWI